MFGVDLGLNVASITLLSSKGKHVDHLVFKGKKVAGQSDWSRIQDRAIRMVKWIVKKEVKAGCHDVAVEEPVYSWGRKNPKVFAKSVALRTLVYYLLTKKGFTVHSINNKAAKMVAGKGNLDKQGMLEAYKKRRGCYPGSTNQKGKETLADSYFIALAGLKRL